MKVKSRVLVLILSSVAFSGLVCSCGVQKQPGSQYADPYPGVKTPQFYQLPVGAVKPRGWLKTTMRISAEGITGHLHEYRPDDIWNTWDNRRYRDKHRFPDHYEVWWPFEQQAYWADGLVQLAYILDDERLKKIADEFINKVLAGQTADGYMGGWPDHPYMDNDMGDIYTQGLLLRVLVSYYSATQDPRIVPAMQKALRHIYVNCKPVPGMDGRLPDAWLQGSARWPIASYIVYSSLWVYSKTGDPQILDLANLAFKATQGIPRNISVTNGGGAGWNDGIDGPADIKIEDLLSDRDYLNGVHGVDTTLLLGIPATHYLYSGNMDELSASINGIEKVDRFHGQVHGAPVSDEELREPTGLHGTETCDIADYSTTKQTMFAITGDVKYADAVERMLFNTFPGSTRPDGRAMQYYSYANTIAQILLPDGNPSVLCCVGEWNRVCPIYVSHAMWLSSPDNGLASACYGPSTVSAKVGTKGKMVSITEETNYPFEEKIHLVLTSSGSTKFPLYLRIPGWCNEASIEINGKLHTDSVLPGRLVKIDRLWSDGDYVDLHLPMHVGFSRWDKGSVAIERGPLVYALRIKENWKKAGERFPGFPDWEVRAGSDWNYALCFRLSRGTISRRRLDDDKSEVHAGDSYFTVNYPKVPEGSNPWEYPPIELIGRGKKVDGWRLSKELPRVLPPTNDATEAFTPDVPQSPVINDNPVQEITLIPYGCTRVRVTYFPVAELPPPHAH